MTETPKPTEAENADAQGRPALAGSTACPRCGKPLVTGRKRPWWFAMCEDDGCGFAETGATTLGLQRKIEARKR